MSDARRNCLARMTIRSLTEARAHSRRAATRPRKPLNVLDLVVPKPTGGEDVTHQPPVVADFVAEVGEQPQGGLGERQAPATLGHVVGHDRRGKVHIDRLTGVGEFDFDGVRRA